MMDSRDSISAQSKLPGRRRFDERRFFDRVDYIVFRLFLLAMALVGMYSVLKAHH